MKERYFGVFTDNVSKPFSKRTIKIAFACVGFVSRLGHAYCDWEINRFRTCLVLP